MELVLAAREGRPSDLLIFPKYISRPKLTHEEFRHLLDEMGSMSSCQSLPLDFSSADI